MLKSLYRGSLRLALDVCAISLALFLAYYLRFEGGLGPWQVSQILTALPYLIAARLVCGRLLGVNRIAWRYVSLRDIPRMLAAIVPPSAFFLALRVWLPDHYDLARLPLSIIALEAFFSFVGILGVRVSRRWFVEHRLATHSGSRPEDTKRVLLVGAGGNGYIIAREIRSRRDLALEIVGFIDDDPKKVGLTVHGVKVIGPTSLIPKLVEKFNIDRVIITIARATRAEMKRIVDLCESAEIQAQIVPGLHELVDGSVSINRIRNVEVEDLLGRDPVLLDVAGIGRFLRQNRVLVTGAGGSIGSEMCRQVCRFEPACLILVERSENNLFEIERELRSKFPAIKIASCIADITEQDRMERLFHTHGPQVVIHAAAYKHVPLMEENSGEAIKNNVFGTKTLADMSDAFGVESFVMISTDKAVNPTSVMGATKRVAEMYVQSLSRRSRTRFITVRFGNVLGSVGSVIPIFKQQIAKGGPVTITHPEMKRYFMTIPEASQLVLQAASMGRGGEIFVLDMGEPVKVLSLAEQLIRLSGLRPYEDIEIAVTGVRPGEKLFEEIALNEEAVSKTRHDKIYVGRFRPIPQRELEGALQRLSDAASSTENTFVRSCLMQVVALDRAATSEPDLSSEEEPQPEASLQARGSAI